MINESWGYKPERPRTVPFDFSYAKGSDDLPMDRPPLAKTASEVEPEQIHIALAGKPDTCKEVSSYVPDWAFQRRPAQLTRGACSLNTASASVQLTVTGAPHYQGQWYFALQAHTLCNSST